MTTTVPPRPPPGRAAAPSTAPTPSRRRPLLAPGLLAPLGVLAGGVGLGLGVRHLQKTGLSAVTVAGLALLAAGLGLLGAAGRRHWRSGPGWRRLWLLPAGLAALLLVWTVGFAVMVTVVPPTPLPAGTAAPAGLPGAEVGLRTADGVRLSAWWVPGRAGAAVLLLHGAGENRGAVLPHARVLARHGYAVLLLDARGHGRSGGRGMDLGWYGDADVRAGVDFLARQDGVATDRIAVLGLSLGGEEAIGAAAADPRIRAVVAEGATGRSAADKARWLPGGAPGTLQRGLDRLTYAVVDLLTPAGPPTPLRSAVAAAGGTSFLLVTAGTEPDEARAAAVLQAAAPARVQVWTAAGAGHTGALGAHPADWERRVTGFLATALRLPGD